MIYIIIPVFNRWNFTQACLQSLQKQSFTSFKIILVDHGSTDNTSTLVKEFYPEVILVQGSNQLWWTGATNLGIRHVLESYHVSDDDFILTLNNDLVVESDYLVKIIDTYQQNLPCVVGSLSVDINSPDDVDYAGTQWKPSTAKYNKLKTKFPKVSLIRQLNLSYINSDLLPGRGTLFPMFCFKKLGLFDELNFPHYVADEDYSLLCHRNGFKLIVSTHAVVYSHTNATGIGLKNELSFIDFFKSFRSIRSSNNFKRRWLWARKNVSNPILYTVFDYSRIIGSYFKSKWS